MSIGQPTISIAVIVLTAPLGRYKELPPETTFPLNVYVIADVVLGESRTSICALAY
jgi:hypothetical protein